MFDEVWLKPQWDLLEEDLYARELIQQLEHGACIISTLDLEIEWLARNLPAHRRLLTPQAKALGQTGKPAPSVAELLPFGTPPTLELTASDEEIYAFCRAHSFRVWIKGPYHEALPVRSWAELERARADMKKRWRSSRLFIQAHVRGYEESIGFAAYGGKLIDAVYMKKRIVTNDGKTWAGRIADVPPQLLSVVEQAVQTIGWTGGAEIELLRDVDGQLWLMEWNPRFPGWIHGATLAGRNLPAALVQTALGLPLNARPTPRAVEFTRCVLEVPVRTELPLPRPFEPDHDLGGSQGKYGNVLAPIVPKLADARPQPPSAAAPRLSDDLSADLREIARVPSTPARCFFPRTARAAFTQVDNVLRR